MAAPSEPETTASNHHAALPVGVGAAIAAAVLFGISTPFAKLLLGRSVPPVLLAALLYLGSGLGLTALFFWRRARKDDEAPLTRADLPWLTGAVLFGGVLGPILLMVGLRATPASTAALLLNLEGVFTSLLAWFVFKENFDRRIFLGMVVIVAGGLLLSWQGSVTTLPLGALAIAGACLCWGIDNNLTQKISASNPFQVAAIKGAVAGTVNLGIALSLGAHLPAPPVIGGALLVGFIGYGLSLAAFVLALRHIGTARTGAYFSLAPFVGAIVALLLLHEPLSSRFLIAAVLMAVGVWLHLTERHEHTHTHDPLTHTHSHVHDAHHQHPHAPGIDPTEPHTHEHTHTRMRHKHPHYPDIHHRHTHE